jgi:hypothetical protein
MNRARLGIFFAAAMFAVYSLPVHAQNAKEPLEGTWLLDVGKSIFSPLPGLKGQMRTYAMSNGVEKMTARGIGADGKPTLVQYTARYDGNDYDIIGSSGGNRISLKRIDRLTTESTEKHDGKPTIVATRHVSDDGKTLTVDTHGTLPDGRQLQATLVFHRD